MRTLKALKILRGVLAVLGLGLIWYGASGLAALGVLCFLWANNLSGAIKNPWENF